MRTETGRVRNRLWEQGGGRATEPGTPGVPRAVAQTPPSTPGGQHHEGALLVASDVPAHHSPLPPQLLGLNSGPLASPRVFGPHAQALQHLCGGHLAVEGVEVEAWHQATCQKLLAQADGLLDAVVADGSIVILDGLDHVLHLLRHLQPGQLHQLPKGVVTLPEDRECCGATSRPTSHPAYPSSLTPGLLDNCSAT